MGLGRRGCFDFLGFRERRGVKECRCGMLRAKRCGGREAGWRGRLGGRLRGRWRGG